MPTRNRSRQAPAITGSATQFPSGSTVTRNCIPYTETCTDVLGNRYGDNALSLDRTTRTINVLNGDNRPPPHTTTTFASFANCPASGHSGSAGHQVLPSLPNVGALATTVAAKTNPSRPVVDIVTDVIELREVASLVQYAGKTLLQRGAGAFLNYQFGWKPLLADLDALGHLTLDLRKRAVEIRKLFEEGGLHHKISLQSDVVVNVTTPTIESLGSKIVTARQTQTTIRNVWGTIRWVPNGDSLPPMGQERYELYALRAVLGLTFDARTAWNALPWTWLLDWFGNVDEWLLANRNMMPCHHERICIMTQTKTTTLGTRTPDNFDLLTGGDYLFTRDTKVRQVGVTPALSAKLPFVTARHVSILGALNVNRLRGLHL